MDLEKKTGKWDPKEPTIFNKALISVVICMGQFVLAWLSFFVWMEFEKFTGAWRPPPGHLMESFERVYIGLWFLVNLGISLSPILMLGLHMGNWTRYANRQ